MFSVFVGNCRPNFLLFHASSWQKWDKTIYILPFTNYSTSFWLLSFPNTMKVFSLEGESYIDFSANISEIKKDLNVHKLHNEFSLKNVFILQLKFARNSEENFLVEKNYAILSRKRLVSLFLNYEFFSKTFNVAERWNEIKVFFSK